MTNQVPIRVLVIDDEDSIRIGLAAFLDDEGFTTMQAGTAEDALKLLETNTADAAIVDIRLPGMDGEHFIMEANRRWPGIKFLVHTGSCEYSMAPELKKAGVTEKLFFRKPIADMSLLSKTIRELVTDKNK